MADEELKLPLRLMSLEALRREEDRLLDELHRVRDRRDAVGREIMARLDAQSTGTDNARGDESA